MNCIKEKRFLFWKYKKIKHSYKINFISKFMNTSTTFHVNYKCENCGANHTEKFVEQDELLLLGISVEDLEKINSFNYHYPINTTPN